MLLCMLHNDYASVCDVKRWFFRQDVEVPFKGAGNGWDKPRFSAMAWPLAFLFARSASPVWSWSLCACRRVSPGLRCVHLRRGHRDERRKVFALRDEPSVLSRLISCKASAAQCCITHKTHTLHDTNQIRCVSYSASLSCACPSLGRGRDSPSWRWSSSLLFLPFLFFSRSLHQSIIHPPSSRSSLWSQPHPTPYTPPNHP